MNHLPTKTPLTKAATMNTAISATAQVTQTAATPKETPKFQQYLLSRKSTQMITHKGTKFSFVNNQLLTRNAEVIAYLDEEISLGLRDVTKGELMTSEQADPMAALKANMKKQLLAEIAEEAKQAALGNTPDMGSTVPKQQQVTMGSTSTMKTGAGSSSNNQAV